MSKVLLNPQIDPIFPLIRSTEGNPERAAIITTDLSMPIEIGGLAAGEEEAWEQFVEHHSQSAIYHSLSWKVVTQEGLGHTPYYLRALNSSGQMVGILPLFLITGLYGRRLVSVPMRDRGGVIAQDHHIASQLVGQAIRLAQELNCRYLEMKFLHELAPDVSSTHNLQLIKHWITTRMDLTPGSQHLWDSLDKKRIRWAIRKAERDGIQVTLDDTLEGINLFYDMFVKTRCFMGIPPYPRSFFIAIWQHLILKGKANLFLVRKNSSAIHGMINFFFNDTCGPAYTAPQKAWAKYHANESLFWHSIKWASEQGFHFYDFGADSPKQEGLLWWKMKWGGIQHPIYSYYWLAGSSYPPNFDSSHPMYALIRKTWRVLPIPLAKLVGGWVTKQLS